MNKEIMISFSLKHFMFNFKARFEIFWREIKLWGNIYGMVKYMVITKID